LGFFLQNIKKNLNIIGPESYNTDNMQMGGYEKTGKGVEDQYILTIFPSDRTISVIDPNYG